MYLAPEQEILGGPPVFFSRTLFFLQCGRWENIQGQVEELAYQRQDERPWERVMGLLVCFFASFRPDVLTPSLVF